MKKLIVVVMMSLVVALCGIAGAGVLLPVGVTAPGDSPARMIDDADAAFVKVDANDVMTWESTGASNNSWNYWESWDGATVVFDLGAEYDLSKAYIWNYTHGGTLPTRQMHTFDISVSDDDVSYTPVGSADLPNNNDSTALQRTNAEDLTGATGVRYVQFYNMATYGDNQGGMSQVRFESVEAPPIPEPAGLGLVGLALLAVRRRRS